MGNMGGSGRENATNVYTDCMDSTEAKRLHAFSTKSHLWSSPLDWDLTSVHNVVVAVLEIPRHAKVTDLQVTKSTWYHSGKLHTSAQQ